MAQVASGVGLEGCVILDGNGVGLGGGVKVGTGPSAALSITGSAKYSSQTIEEMGGCDLFLEGSAGSGFIAGLEGETDFDGNWSAGLSGGAGMVFTPVAPFTFDVFGGVSCSDAFYIDQW